jgi:hypothetical protein
MKFKMSKPLVNSTDFVPRREITFDINIEQIVDLSRIVDEDRMYDLVGEAVKDGFVKFMKNDMKRQLKLEEENTPQHVKDELAEMDKILFEKNSPPNPIPKKVDKPPVDFDILKVKNAYWHARWNLKGGDDYIEAGIEFGESPYVYRQTLLTQINRIKAQITKDTYDTPKLMFTHYNTARILESLSTYQMKNDGSYKIGDIDVYYTDKLEDNGKIYILSEKLFNLRVMPKLGDGEVSFLPIDTFTEEEVESFKKKLMGCITIDNYETLQGDNR